MASVVFILSVLQMTLQFSLVQADNRYCIMGYVAGDRENQEAVGWTNDHSMAEQVLTAVIQRWPKYGGGKILDFGGRG